MKFQNYVTSVRLWMISKISVDNFKFPSDDEVWEYITTTWKTISTDNAEFILNEAMKMDR